MSGKRKLHLPLLLGGLLMAGLAMGGCRKEEQNRTLLFEKGTYLGNPDQALTDEQRADLRYRASKQSD
ncbi:MAG: hypothetical protein OEZ03_04970 [Alphaproteobacteria bacterium]|nr:hypothetical protein [Alphaproteobacteria bacterium]